MASGVRFDFLGVRNGKDRYNRARSGYPITGYAEVLTLPILTVYLVQFQLLGQFWCHLERLARQRHFGPVQVVSSASAVLLASADIRYQC